MSEEQAAEELTARQDRLQFDDDGLVIDRHYFIAKERIDTPEKLLGWVNHLLEKRWADALFLRQLIGQAGVKYGYDVHGGE